MALGEINSGNDIITDTELTQEGVPADAKSVADQIAELKQLIAKKMDDEVITITKSITITTDWQDTGIKSTDISPSGTYAVQFYGGSPTISIWGDYFSGVMSWYNGGTNGSNADEIPLHCAGHARNGQLFYLRTLRHGRNGDDLTLQIKGSSAASSADTFTFKFRRLI